MWVVLRSLSVYGEISEEYQVNGGIVMDKDYQIRRVKPGDESILARIQTESWKAAFKDIVEEELLRKSTDLDRATDMYRKLLEQQIGNGYILEVKGAAHCIAWWDAVRDADLNGYAELICIHSLPGNWRRGYGSRMMETVLRDAAAAGFRNIVLWVFEENERARRFYEAHGFVKTDRTKIGLGAVEVMYARSIA